MTKSPNSRAPRAAFTLIELLVVIVIIGILAAIVLPRFSGKTGQAKISAAKQQIENFSLALDSYQLDNGAYPSTEQGLAALIKKPSGAPEAKGWRGPYMRKKDLPPDPWGNPFQYTCPGRQNTEDYDVSSYGADGKEGGEGESADIGNW